MKRKRTTKALALALSGLLTLSGAGFATVSYIAAPAAYAEGFVDAGATTLICEEHDYYGDPRFETCPMCPAASASSITLNGAGASVANPVEYNIYKLFSANVSDEGMASDVRYTAPFSAEIMMGVVPSKPVTPDDPTDTEATAPNRAAIVERAMTELGKPYQWGGIGPDGYDASGLVGYAITGQHIRIGAAAAFLTYPETTEPVPGDICVKADGQHCGIYIGDGHMIHAPQMGQTVKIAPVQSDMVYRIASASTTAAPEEEETEPGFEYAQVAAQYIADNIADGSRLAADDFGMKLARAIAATSAEPMTILSDGAPVEVDGPGYYLIARKDALEGTDTAASSPIFLLVGEGNTTVTEKRAIPTVSKYVKEDSTGEYGKTADDTTRSYIDFKLVGTLPSDLSSYEAYFYAFRDKADSKLQTAPRALTVKIDGVALADYRLETDPDTGGFSVIIDDILALDGFEVSPSSEIVVEYQTILEEHAPKGAVNEVYVEYSNNPVNIESHGTTKTDEVKVYSAVLTIEKKDDTGAPLPGVGFIVKNTEGAYIIRGEYGKDDNAGEYYTAESADPYVWYTDENGRLVIKGIDFDDYIIEETDPLESYIPLDGTFTVRITTEDREAIEYEITEKPEHGVSMAEDAVEVINMKQVQLPLTGMAGYAGLILMGLALIGFALYRLRRKDVEEE